MSAFLRLVSLPRRQDARSILIRGYGVPEFLSYPISPLTAVFASARLRDENDNHFQLAVNEGNPLSSELCK